MPQKDWLQCQLALAEGFTNAVRHAHKKLPTDTPIELEVTVYPASIELRIWDLGLPFNLQERLKDSSQKPDEHSEGGRGLILMQKIADRLSYSRINDEKNCLLIVKHYSSTENDSQQEGEG